MYVKNSEIKDMNLALAIDQFSMMRSRDPLSRASLQAFDFLVIFNAPTVVTI
jgi:hypothetical protein